MTSFLKALHQTLIAFLLYLIGQRVTGQPRFKKEGNRADGRSVNDFTAPDFILLAMFICII